MPGTLGGLDTLSRGWRSADRQQPHREQDPAGGCWAFELAVGRLSARRSACRRDYEPDPVRQAQRTRSVPLPQGRARAPTHSIRQPSRGTTATSLATDMSPPYNASHAVDSAVRIAGRMVLDDFAKTWKLHNPLSTEQLAFAGRESTVKSVGF